MDLRKHIDRAPATCALFDKEVARELGISPNYLSEILSGDSWPSRPVRAEFYRLLGMTPEQFEAAWAESGTKQ